MESFRDALDKSDRGIFDEMFSIHIYTIQLGTFKENHAQLTHGDTHRHL
jgi:hypothetical protein